MPALNTFFEKITRDERLNATHLCVYLALFQCWSKNNFQNPVSIRRAEIMRLSKVSAKTTYHKCMKNLHAAGYIKYEPSYKPEGSMVHVLTV